MDARTPVVIVVVVAVVVVAVVVVVVVVVIVVATDLLLLLHPLTEGAAMASRPDLQHLSLPSIVLRSTSG